MKDLFNRYLLYLEKRSKRRSLERLRQHYLEKYDENEELVKGIFYMKWTEEQKREQFLYMKNQSLPFKQKADDLAKQIREL